MAEFNDRSSNAHFTASSRCAEAGLSEGPRTPPEDALYLGTGSSDTQQEAPVPAAGTHLTAPPNPTFQPEPFSVLAMAEAYYRKNPGDFYGLDDSHGDVDIPKNDAAAEETPDQSDRLDRVHWDDGMLEIDPATGSRSSDGIPQVAPSVRAHELGSFAAAFGEESRKDVFTCGGHIPIVLHPNTDGRGNLTPRTTRKAQDQLITTSPVTIRWGPDGHGKVLSLPCQGDDAPVKLQRLVDECVPATFGRNGKDVYDESYRRAGALDAADFAVDFCPYKTGIVDVVTQLLLPTVVGELKPRKHVPIPLDELTSAHESEIAKVFNRFKLSYYDAYAEDDDGPAISARRVAQALKALKVPIKRGEPLEGELLDLAEAETKRRQQQLLDLRRQDVIFQQEFSRLARRRLLEKLWADWADVTAQEQKPLEMSRGLRAELYKLNVYSGPSGLFKPHVDTPRSEEQIGSLVVSLPVPFKGGALAVRHRGQEVLHDWSTSEDEHDAAIQWAAFYSDCEHEVMEVTAGHRITLTYNLCLSPGTGLLNSRPSSLTPDRLPLYRHVRALLDEQSAFSSGEYLGLHLTHRYPHAHPTLYHFVPKMLKGADMAAYGAFAATGLTCLIIPLNTRTGLPPVDCLEQLEQHHRISKRDGNRTLASLLSPLEVNNELDEHEVHEDDILTESSSEGGMCDQPYNEYKARRMETRKQKRVRNRIVWLNCPGIEEMSQVALAYGNQAELKVSYSSVALLVKIPPWEERESVGMEDDADDAIIVDGGST